MHIVIAAGGTAGHINPALALAEELVARGHDVSFVGTSDKLESQLVPEAGYPFFGIEVSGFVRSKPWTLVTSGAKMLKASRAVEAELRRIDPDLAIGFGAYVEVPLALAAKRIGIPFALHEQNSVPGMANLQMAHRADLVALSYPTTEPLFRRKTSSRTHIVTTGNPVRTSVTNATREHGRELFDLGEKDVVLTVFGGSLGARRINQAAMGAVPGLLASYPDLVVVHSTGADGYGMVSAVHTDLGETAERWRIHPYIQDMGLLIAASDLVLSRAGASSIAEISALGTPSILIPYPHARGDHQRINAAHLVSHGAARMIADEELNAASFDAAVRGSLDDPDALHDMRNAASELDSGNAAARLADEVVRAARGATEI